MEQMTTTDTEAGTSPRQLSGQEGILQPTVHPQRLKFVCLGFNGTFSTNRLYRAI